MFEISGGHWFAANPDATFTDAFGEERTLGTLFDTVEGTVQPQAHVTSNIGSPLIAKVQAAADHWDERILRVFDWTGRYWHQLLEVRR